MESIKKRPLWVYVISVAVVWAIVLFCVWTWNNPHFTEVAIFCGGYWVGMLAMFIAIHIYRWK